MGNQPLWVFGYGSLIWHPGFEFDESHIARISGYHRSFCMRSIHHRGTETAPGLVLALDAQPGGGCDGVAFRVRPGQEAATITYLRERELISSAYIETHVSVDLVQGPTVQALTFIVDQNHSQYCRDIPLEQQAEIILAAKGDRGPNTEYLFNTVTHLQGLGIADPDLEWLENRVRGLSR